MDNAVALPTPLPVSVADTFGARIKAMPARAKLSTAVGILALIGVTIALIVGANQGDYKLLYANLSDKDGGAVLAQLTTLNVPYKFAPGSGAILVPAAMVPDLRLKLATAGLPKGAVTGFELMDTARFGQTQFQERLSFQRGLEGELTRSIVSLAAVQNARVHLALPNQNGFFREQQKPSASVLLTLNAGRTLDRAQLAGIVHLVSSSVPELDPKAVSILDQTGALLTASADSNPTNGMDPAQLQYVNQIEAGYTKRIVALLEPLVGRDNLRASVTADVDFSQTDATSEAFKPNKGTDASISIRSEQTNEQSGASGGLPSGVPGAASNQPPIAATAPLVGASQPLLAAPLSGASANGRREAVTNYEVDRTVRVTRGASGMVKRLNAAVVVNNRTVVDARGKSTQVALTAEDLDKYSALVRESIGLNAERGDSVKVINAAFRVEPTSTLETTWWKQADTLDLIRSLAVPGALLIVALLVFLGLLKPGFKALQAAVPPSSPLAGLLAIEDEMPPAAAILPGPHTARSKENLEGIRLLARQNPAAVAGILRSWVGTEAPVPAPR
jgi:flagellar M-ring protein FliF